MEAVPYKEAVGALFYLARSTRFDIAHACGQVARFMDRPCARHWRAVLRIYDYLARTKDVALVMKSRGMQCELGDQFLEGLADADWAGCGETRKSHTGPFELEDPWSHGTLKGKDPSPSRQLRRSMWPLLLWLTRSFGGGDYVLTWTMTLEDP